MARDPPSLISSSELRDLSLNPSQVRNARITIVHPQLRDLILPLERGHVLYPRGNSIEEQKWDASNGRGDSDDEGSPKTIVNGSSKTFAKLSFTPNCLTARGEIMACGGQHGELYLTSLPSSPKSSGLTSRFTTSAPVRPFSLSVTLPTRSINNSLTILPDWPEEWKQREHDKRLGRIGRREAIDEYEDATDFDGSNEDYRGEDEDVLMELDSEEEEEEDDDDEEDMLLGSPSSSVATYPNTVPFLHAPRIPNLPTSPIFEIPTTSRSRRSTSFGGSESHHSRPRDIHRSTLSSSYDTPSNVRYVTSLPRSSQFGTSPSSSSIGSSARIASKKRERRSEPRLLISNNDQTVKMFSLGSIVDPRQSRFRGRLQEQDEVPLTATVRQREEEARDRLERMMERRGIRSSAPVPVPPPRFGSSFGWDGIGINEGIRSQTADEALQRELYRAREYLRTEREAVARRRADFERLVGMRVGTGVGSTGVFGLGEGIEGSPSSPPAVAKEREERKLSKVGGSRFKYAINHSSLSPDLKTMVSVGDSTDVYLFEVIDGGREFRRIGTYSGATDSGFSTSWSKDGRKFAVASQDGQVTVWDHRSSHPLAIFHTSSAPSHGSSPSFTSDLAASRHGPRRQRYTSPFSGPEVVLIDPVTGDSQTGSSTSGREAARVVKFSPEGSSRDLMVFTEENSNIHIIDARTFHTHVIVPVPHVAPSSTEEIAYRERTGVEGGTWGVAGAAFDPTGDWLYSGTEKTVVEWDLRSVGSAGTGTWAMA